MSILSTLQPEMAVSRPPILVPADLTISDAEFKLFQELILQKTGIFLHDSKRHLIPSRLASRLRLHGFKTFSEYHAYLMQKGDPGELESMINRITTNKTSFFRENHHFEFLKTRLIPEIQEKARHGAPRRIRIWSAACSSGEEPYSVAISLLEALESHAGWDIRILATDLDSAVLQQAKAGVYAEERVAELPLEIKRKYFLRGREAQAGSVCVRPQLKRLITFRQLNFIAESWPIQAEFDMILCRNVIIYFNRETQRQLFTRLLSYLKADGYLCVGHSESLHWLGDLFVPLRNTIYQPRPKTTERPAACS